MSKRFFFIFLFAFFSLSVYPQKWQPDAGLIRPYTAQVNVSSGQNRQNIVDGDPHTFWQSSNPLPHGYLRRRDLNYFLNGKHFFRLSGSQSLQAFDGNTDTHMPVTGKTMMFDLRPPVSLLLLSLKADVQDTLYLLLETANHNHYRLKYSVSDNFQVKNFPVKRFGKIVSVQLKSRKPYALYELGALQHNPVEYVIFDYGKPVDIGWISSRQLNSDAVTGIKVWAGNDKRHWQPVIRLNPGAIPLLQTPLKKPVHARYLKITFTLIARDYQKAVLWEFAAYNRYGPYGPPPAAHPSYYTFSQAFGINTVWGWGYSVYSDRLKPGTGPQQFIAVSKNVRSYERLDWDMLRPQQVPDFDKMATGAGTPAKPWLNWDREYGNWKKIGFRIDITLAFKQDNFPDTLWRNTYREAFAFGKAYATHFFKKEHLVSMIEIGNEPWDYNSQTYRRILAGMSAGMKSVSTVPVLPCAVQAYAPQKDDKDYIAHYVDASSAKEIDGLNTHIYSYVFQEDGKRKAVNPEDPRSQVWSMANLIRFRNTNLPGKPVYVTEFGYDSNGGGENCTHSECVPEKVQAIYGIRMAMILWRLGARQFYWYYFANVAYNSFMHNRSGLCGSYKTGFRKKASFGAFAFLQQQIGPYRFDKVIRENHEVYAYLLKDPRSEKKIVIAWRPTAREHFAQKQILFPIPGKVQQVISVLENRRLSFIRKNGRIMLPLSGEPVLIRLE